MFNRNIFFPYMISTSAYTGCHMKWRHTDFDTTSYVCWEFACADRINDKTGPEVIKLFSCSTQLSMKFFLLINVKIPAIVGILTFMSGRNSLLSLFETKKAEFLDILYFCAFKISCSIESSMKKVL